MKFKICAIIPARGGSKAIPRKNISLLNGKPLIFYSIEVAKQSRYDIDFFVSTDDDEIAEISLLYGAGVIKRPSKLAKNDIPLDPVIYHAVDTIEKQNNISFDYVITLQPTCPLLTVQTLDKAIKEAIENEQDTLISVKDETHLFWTKKKNRFIPLYEIRKNRQYLDPVYKETGALVISKRKCVTVNSRFGKTINPFEVPAHESIDIDSYEDWWLAERFLKKKKIVFRVDGDKNIGLGHVYRTITLAKRLIFYHDVYFVMNKKKELGVSKVREYHFNVVSFSDESSVLTKIQQLHPDIVINDFLDTEKKYIGSLKQMGCYVINIEDLGEGADAADVVINALYENSYPPKNHYYGYKYICLRDEFFIFPRKSVKETVDHILVTFGGTDQNNLTMKTLNAIEKLGYKDITVSVVLGLGYMAKEHLIKYITQLQEQGFKIDLKENVSMMAKEMYHADVVITSNGRTLYEVASVATPCISIAQNERESRHLFVHHSKCIQYLGMASSVSADTILAAIQKVVDDYNLRKEMNHKLLQFDLRNGINRVIDLIQQKEISTK